MLYIYIKTCDMHRRSLCSCRAGRSHLFSVRTFTHRLIQDKQLHPSEADLRSAGERIRLAALRLLRVCCLGLTPQHQPPHEKSDGSQHIKPFKKLPEQLRVSQEYEHHEPCHNDHRNTNTDDPKSAPARFHSALAVEHLCLIPDQPDQYENGSRQNSQPETKL